MFLQNIAEHITSNEEDKTMDVVIEYTITKEIKVNELDAEKYKNMQITDRQLINKYAPIGYESAKVLVTFSC